MSAAQEKSAPGQSNEVQASTQEDDDVLQAMPKEDRMQMLINMQFRVWGRLQAEYFGHFLCNKRQ